MKVYVSSRARLGLALIGASAVSIGLFGVGAISNQSFHLSSLVWNLALAWIPLFFALWLERTLSRKLWSSFQALALTILWILFLPNSFYMITDFIHLQEVQRVDLLFDIVMVSSFVINALLLGYISLYLLHKELEKRLTKRWTVTLVGLVLLLSSFAVYVGRDLRWSTWDVIVNPASILFDVSDRVLNPATHPRIVSTTLSFFVLLTSIYITIYYIARVLRAQKSR